MTATATKDHPHVRASHQCPLCHRTKNAGLVTCWECYHAHELKYGNPFAEDLIDKTEAKLAQPFELESHHRHYDRTSTDPI